MMKSLYSGVSGLKNHTVRMDVIGNNIANVNTTAYKANTVTFRDVYYQTRSFASAGTNISGGTNPRQVGYGLAMGSIDKVMTQSGFTFSDKELDCAIQGEGFFQVMDAAGNIYYTRNGTFDIDNYGNLVDSNGYIVLGVSGDPTGVGPSSQRINLFIPDVWNEAANATKTITINDLEYEVTFSVSGFGPAGNIGINISHSETPYATMNGSVLSVQLDLTVEFASAAEFEAAVNAAIQAGGIDPGEGILPINIQFSGVPLDTSAIAAQNDMVFVDRTVTPNVTHALRFTADTPGEAQNNFIVAMKTSSSATGVTAKWSQNVVTVTIPETGLVTVPGTPPTTRPVQLSDIQEALDNAAGVTRTPAGDPAGVLTPGLGNENRAIQVTIPGSAALPTAPLPFDLHDLLGTVTRQMGFLGGQDNFFRTVVQKMQNIALKDGRFASAQTTNDLDLIFIDSGGVIYGEHPVHGRLLLGRIDIALFQNVNGLSQFGTSYYKESLASGNAEVKVPESDGAGEIVSGALEMANVDMSQEFSDMIITQRGFQANSRIITVSDTMLEELINLKR